MNTVINTARSAIDEMEDLLKKQQEEISGLKAKLQHYEGSNKEVIARSRESYVIANLNEACANIEAMMNNYLAPASTAYNYASHALSNVCAAKAMVKAE